MSQETNVSDKVEFVDNFAEHLIDGHSVTPTEETEQQTVTVGKDEKYGTTTTDDDLPIMYSDTTNKKEDVICVIGPDLGDDGQQPHNGKYLAVFQNLTLEEEKIGQLENLTHVDKFRNELALQGWRFVKRPTINVNKKLNRQQRRAMEREMKKEDKKKAKQKQRVEERKQRVKRDIEKRKKLIDSMANTKK